MTSKILPDTAELVACAHALADLAAAETLPRFRLPGDVDNKASGGAYDPVTVADRSAEAAISRYLATTFPDHGMEGEEFGVVRPDAPFRWVIDPIDGTRAFITGSPMWGTLIGLTYSGVPRIGVMDQPFTGERFWSDGAVSHMRRGAQAPVRMATRRCGVPQDAVLMTTDPALFADGAERAGFEAVQARVRMTRYGGDCYAYAMLAAGFVDVVIECGLKPHDVVALIPIVETAGGRFTSWEGSSAAGGGRIIACGDPDLHAQLLPLLAGAG